MIMAAEELSGGWNKRLKAVEQSLWDKAAEKVGNNAYK